MVAKAGCGYLEFPQRNPSPSLASQVSRSHPLSSDHGSQPPTRVVRSNLDREVDQMLPACFLFGSTARILAGQESYSAECARWTVEPRVVARSLHCLWPTSLSAA